MILVKLLADYEFKLGGASHFGEQLNILFVPGCSN